MITRDLSRVPRAFCLALFAGALRSAAAQEADARPHSSQAMAGPDNALASQPRKAALDGSGGWRGYSRCPRDDATEARTSLGSPDGASHGASATRLPEKPLRTANYDDDAEPPTKSPTMCYWPAGKHRLRSAAAPEPRDN